MQDTRFGRIVLAQSHEARAIVDAVTDYISRRMVEREHAFVVPPTPVPVKAEKRRPSVFFTFALGFVLGAAALFALALFAALRDFDLKVQQLSQSHAIELHDPQFLVHAPHHLL